MYPVCACYLEGDWTFGYHPETDEAPVYEWRTSLRPRRCCECWDLIPPGLEYDHIEGWNPDEQQWEIHDTCITCMNIWDDLCGGDRLIGSLNDTLMESCGMDLSGNIDDDDDEYWEEAWQDAIEAEREAERIKQARTQSNLGGFPR
jgi:hypothetical protein